MAAKIQYSTDAVDNVLKTLFVLARAVDHILETRAVEEAIDERPSSSKVQVLRLLGQRGRQTSSQVARYLGVTKPAVSQIIDSMVASKLVTRKRATHDRREVGLELTKSGKEVFQSIRREQRHMVRSALRLSTGRGADRWVKVLQEAAGTLAKADKAYDEFCLQCGAHADGTCVLLGGDADCLFLRHSRSRGPRPSVKKVARKKAVRKKSGAKKSGRKKTATPR